MPVTNYVWDELSDSVLMETDGSGATTAVYTQEPGPFGGLISERRGNESRYYHYDGLGSTRQLTDSTGQVTDTYLYEAFGQLIQGSGTTVNPFRFVGRLGYYFDADLAEYYVRARHYDPRLARWLAVDPIGYEGNNTNLYRYAKNQPTLKVDPDGKIVPAVILGVELGCCGGCALWIGSTLEANWPNCRNQPDPIQCEIDALVAARAGLGWWNRAVLDGECGVCAILLLRRAIMAVSAFCAENPKVCQDIIDAWKRIPW